MACRAGVLPDPIFADYSRLTMLFGLHFRCYIRMVFHGQFLIEFLRINGADVREIVGCGKHGGIA